MKKMQKEKHSTKRSLYMSAVSMLLCLVMLVGTTFAWFTDTVSSKGNRIQAGTLQIKLEAWRKVSSSPVKYDWVDITDSQDPVINVKCFEPNKSGVEYVRVSNAGCLDLEYIVDLVIKSDNPSVNMTSVLKVMTADNVPQTDLNSAAAPVAKPGADFASISTLKEEIIALNATNPNATSLKIAGPIPLAPALPLPGDHLDATTLTGQNIATSRIYSLDYYMCAFAGNKYQGATFNADIVVTAIQYNRYDNNATSADNIYKYVWNEAQLLDAIANDDEGSTIIFMDNIVLTNNTINLTRAHNYDLNGFALDATGVTGNLKFVSDYVNITPCASDFANGVITLKRGQNLEFDNAVGGVINLLPSLVVRSTTKVAVDGAYLGIDKDEYFHNDATYSSLYIQPISFSSDSPSRTGTAPNYSYTWGNFGLVTFQLKSDGDDTNLDLSYGTGNKIVIRPELATTDGTNVSMPTSWFDTSVVPAGDPASGKLHPNTIWLKQQFETYNYTPNRDTSAWEGMLNVDIGGNVLKNLPWHVNTHANMYESNLLPIDKPIKSSDGSINTRYPAIANALFTAGKTNVSVRMCVDLYIQGTLVQTVEYPASVYNYNASTGTATVIAPLNGGIVN